jgi:26S proteasome regulatory subunit N10
MVLEATIIILDNSKYARNGDILPSRFDSQADALGLLANAKLQENQESAVGLMTMGGRNVEVHARLNRCSSLRCRRRAS